MYLKVKQMKKRELNIPLGENENGKECFFDLIAASHVLVAGKTGSGKSFHKSANP